MTERNRLLSFPGEAKLRKAYGMLPSWSTKGLQNRLLEDDIGVSSVNAANNLIDAGMNAGLLDRTGTHGNYIYRLNAAWQRPSWSHPSGYVPRKPRPETPQEAPQQPRVETIARPYLGPAYEGGHLKPHVGLRCAVQGTDEDGELLPCIGGAIVEGLNAQFRNYFAPVG